MNDDQRLLASAALDGDLTAGEQARADGDPEVVAEVARLGRVRDALRAVDVPDLDRREVTIGAALAAFERRSAPPPGAVVAPLPPSRSAGRGTRWLAPFAAAAAVAVIAVGGIVAIRSGGSDDDASSIDLATSQSAVAEADTAEGELRAVPAPGLDQAASTEDAASEATTGLPAADDAGQELAPTTAAAPLRSPEDLAAFVSSRAAAAASSVTPATCSGGTFVGDATYLVDAEPVAVEVFEVDATDQAVARRIGDCVVVARAPLP